MGPAYKSSRAYSQDHLKGGACEKRGRVDIQHKTAHMLELKYLYHTRLFGSQRP